MTSKSKPKTESAAPEPIQQKVPSMSFSSILDTPADAIEAPKPKPVGTYTAIIEGQPSMGETDKGTQFVEPAFKLLAFGEDISADDIEAAGGHAKILGKTVRRKFYLTEDSLFRFKDFCSKKLGMDLADKSVRQWISEMPGRQVVLTIEHIPNREKDGLISVVSDNGFSAI